MAHETNPDLQPARIDREQEIQVLDNLVKNAVSYMPPGGNVMVSSMMREERAVAHVALEVCDSGSPISGEDLPLLFEHFYRGKNARLSGQPGTRLGLPIYKDIVERHMAWIDIESTEPKATGGPSRVWLSATGLSTV
jgi:signal transduction histidine kinase